MENFLKFISRLEVIIAIAVILILLIIWLVLRKVQSNKYKKELAELEVRYNQISSIPLAFKLNKAVAIARVDQVLLKNVALCKDDFDLATSNLKQISQSLADIEDNILMSKFKDHLMTKDEQSKYINDPRMKQFMKELMYEDWLNEKLK